jgi:hypothetical protein
MRWKETLYKRRLKRPLDGPTRQAIDDAYAKRRHEIPVETELHWHPAKPQFTIRSKLLSFVVNFTPDDLVVDAELTLAAKMFATDGHRKQAVTFIESLADDLNL